MIGHGHLKADPVDQIWQQLHLKFGNKLFENKILILIIKKIILKCEMDSGGKRFSEKRKGKFCLNEAWNYANENLCEK